MKVYLGDGVYAEHDPLGIVITTENGIRITNRIVLELEVFSNLIKFVERGEPKNAPQTRQPTPRRRR